MGSYWTVLTHARSVAGPVLTLLYPLYASVVALESTSKLDDEQWLAYWILYSFITLIELLIRPVLEWIPIWYDVKLVFTAWLVLPQFNGAAFLYNKYVRQTLIQRRRQDGAGRGKPASAGAATNGRPRNRTVKFIIPKKVEQ